ncbi:MAG TPA: tRNA (adenosine(37)-N6)-dimethylallyltransferase MiaA [Flavobacteriaceae bacterium]|nr:tRNA (adenosine(37)-N6)-dimethylallyltransferase MiaA [Flavobacteriaceae bacterium]|tara:strand:+ start:8470 stop:9384 length:915 start_codon:yes stop_codon:yes gene_type:complete
MSKKPLLICVVGATAIGKTSLSIALATAFNTEIISADSRQFYSSMNIGTAVPSAQELEAAPHHFIQHKSIFDSYNVGDFEREALLKLDTLFSKKSTAILVGGSGLYVDAVVNGLDHFPDIDKQIREALNTQLDNDGLAFLQQELMRVDPLYYKTMDTENPRRVIRALEIYRATGKPYSSFLKDRAANRNFKTLYIGLTAERPIVYQRINKRVDIMLENGLLEEVKQLRAHKDLNALQTVGYRELFQYFDGTLTLEKAVEEIKKNTRRFAKRQGTWFRKNQQIHWFDYTSKSDDIVRFIKEKNAL